MFLRLGLPRIIEGWQGDAITLDKHLALLHYAMAGKPKGMGQLPWIIQSLRLLKTYVLMPAPQISIKHFQLEH